MNKLSILAGMTALLLAACASGPQAHYWSKQGASLEDANSALAQCKYEVGLHHVTDQDKQKSLVQECMQGKGFQWETRQSSY